MPFQEDRPLLDAFRRGDPVALDRVYRTYAEEIASVLAHGFAFSSGGRNARFHGFSSRFDLEDVLQDVFMRAFGDAARLAYDGQRPYGPYLAAIARSVVIDRLRGNARWDALIRWDPVAAGGVALSIDAGDATDLLEGTVATGGNPERDVENAELAGLLADFQQALPQTEACVFRLRFREGKTLSEVERTTGLSPSQVKTTERKLRERLLSRIWNSGYLEIRTRRGGWLARLVTRHVEKGEA